MEKNLQLYTCKKNGYKIITRNFRCMQGEIDIIAKDEETIVFVEVKTRTSIKYGEAKEAVGKDKQKHIYEAANYYLYKCGLEDPYIRVDVIEVYLCNRKSQFKSSKTSIILTKYGKRCIIYT